MLNAMNIFGKAKENGEFLEKVKKGYSIAIPIWNNKAVLLKSNIMPVYYNGSVTSIKTDSNLFKDIGKILSCMEINSPFIFVDTNGNNIKLAEYQTVTAQMREFREQLAAKELGDYNLVNLIDLRTE